MFSGIGTFEVLVVILVIVVFFGAEKIPELARGIGKGMSEFRKASDSIQNEINKTKRSVSEPPVKEKTDTATKEQIVENEKEDEDKTEIEKDNSKSN